MLRAHMPVGIRSQGWGELREAVVRVHLDTMIFTTAHVGLFEGAVESWAVECEQFVESIAEAFECAAAAVDNTVGPSCFTAIGFGFAEKDLFGKFNDTVEDVTKSAAKFACGVVVGAGRVVNVSHGTGGGDN